jgi:hypothetical protein
MAERQEDRSSKTERPANPRKADSLPGLDPAGGISRDELDTNRSGSRPVEQNDRTRDRELDERLTE